MGFPGVGEEVGALVAEFRVMFAKAVKKEKADAAKAAAADAAAAAKATAAQQDAQDAGAAQQDGDGAQEGAQRGTDVSDAAGDGGQQQAAAAQQPTETARWDFFNKLYTVLVKDVWHGKQYFPNAQRLWTAWGLWETQRAVAGAKERRDCLVCGFDRQGGLIR